MTRRARRLLADLSLLDSAHPACQKHFPSEQITSQTITQKGQCYVSDAT